MADETNESYDVIVIGSGVCGAISAWMLAQTGAKTLILEAGESGSERIELVGRFAAAIRKTPGSPYVNHEAARYSPSPDGDKDYYVQNSTDLFKSTYQRRVGGSTWHFLGNVPRFLPNDFKLKSTYDIGIDWPISYDDLEQDYCESETLLGVSGESDQWDDFLGAYRTSPFPMTKIWESYSDRLVAQQIDGLTVDDIPIRIMNTPQARNSQTYDGRPACAGNSSCVPICPIQAKYDATVHVKKALEAGAILQEKSVVIGCDIDSNTQVVKTVRYKTWANIEHTVSAKIILLAAHSIESAKILLMSNSPNGIANSSGSVGCHLMDHLQGSGVCLSTKPLFPFRGPPTTSGIDIFRDGAFRKEHSAFRMSLGNDGWGRAGSPLDTLTKLIDEEKLFGQNLRQKLEDRLTRQFRISYSTEMLPNQSNRITLSEELDGLGIPRPQIEFHVDDYTRNAFIYAQKVIGEIFRKMGAEEIQFPPPYSGAGHVMGTCRMGEDPLTSVVNSCGRSHDHPNLFIVGSSVFPTCGTANPTLTAVALTLRSIREIKKTLNEEV